jgi:hypothetical protein
MDPLGVIGFILEVTHRVPGSNWVRFRRGSEDVVDHGAYPPSRPLVRGALLREIIVGERGAILFFFRFDRFLLRDVSRTHRPLEELVMGRFVLMFVLSGLLVFIVGEGGVVSAKDKPIDPDAAPGGEREPAPKEKASPKTKPSRRRPVRQGADGVPVCSCTREAKPSRPPARSMPDMFQRMSESFMRNPATGFSSFVNDLSEMEGPAVQGITVSAAEEREAGRRARVEYLAKAKAQGYRVVNDRVRLDYLKSLVDRLAKRMRHHDRYPEIEVNLIDAPIPDGQSFPGGFLVFTTALLDEPDEATVVGVVAHELAHLDRGHLYGYVRRSKLAENTYKRPGGADLSFDQFFTRQMALFGLMFNPFRPEHETEADCTAVTWMYQEGYDPHALVGFFERLHDRKNDQPDNPFFSFGRTHPFSLDRRNHVLSRLAQLQRWRPRNDLGLFADNLKQRVAKEPEPPVK